MFVEAGLIQAKYEVDRDTNPDFYPKIHSITDACAELNVQSLIDYTIKRLLLHFCEEVLEQLAESEKQSFVLISKWGCDGSQQRWWMARYVTQQHIPSQPHVAPHPPISTTLQKKVPAVRKTCNLVCLCCTLE